MRYATLADVEAGFRKLEEDEQRRCLALLEEAATIIDTCSENAATGPQAAGELPHGAPRFRRRSRGQLYPMGATQGSASAMGYTQSWTMSGGSSGELYLSKLEKRLLGLGSRVGAHSPLEDLT